MKIPSRKCQASNCKFGVPMLLEKEGLCLDHHLECASQKLAAATQDFKTGIGVDYRTMDWLLTQVDFAVAALAQEDSNWDPDQRAKLLELLLDIASLNEYLRQKSIATQLAN